MGIHNYFAADLLEDERWDEAVKIVYMFYKLRHFPRLYSRKMKKILSYQQGMVLYACLKQLKMPELKEWCSPLPLRQLVTESIPKTIAEKLPGIS